MRTIRLYQPVDLTPGHTISLDARNNKHLLQVLRLKPGAELEIFNHLAQCHHAVLETASREGGAICIGEPLSRQAESPLWIELAQGISRGERMEFTIQKAVELGVSSIQPLWTRRTQVRLSGARLEKRTAHWQGIAISACEQCGRNRVPAIHAPVTLEEWLAANEFTRPAIYLDPTSDSSIDKPGDTPNAMTLLAGPEGGLAPEERQLLQDAGWLGVRLGPRVFRTETAALAALSIVQWLWGDLDGTP